MKLLVEHGMEHADAENDGISDKISASSSSVAGWWVIYDVEMWHLYHRHDSGFLPCQRAYNKQQLCEKWTFWYNMGWSTVMQKNKGYFRRKTYFLCILGKFSVFLRAISHMYMPPMFLSFYHILIYPLLPDMAKYGVSTPTYDGAWLRRFFFQKKKTYPKNGDHFF